jgi:hypothetical protein
MRFPVLDPRTDSGENHIAVIPSLGVTGDLRTARKGFLVRRIWTGWETGVSQEEQP